MALGAADRLVGRSHECDHPADLLAGVPVLTGSTLTPLPEGPALDPAAIDRAVREAAHGGRSISTLDRTRLTDLTPDLIITQDLCGVCALEHGSVARTAASISPPPRVLSLSPTTIEGVLDSILAIGEAIGLADRAGALAVQTRERLFAASEYVNPFDDGPTVAVLDWTDPLFIAGHWTPQLVERAGARHPLNPTHPKPGSGAAIGPQMAERIAAPSSIISAEALGALDPEWVIIAPCGMSLDHAFHAAQALAERPWFNRLRALAGGKVLVVDGNRMFSRPGLGLADAFEFLVGMFNDRPELIPIDFPYRRLPEPGHRDATRSS